MEKMLGILLLLTLLTTAGCSKASSSNATTNIPKPSAQTSQLPSTPQVLSVAANSQLTFSWIDLKNDILSPTALTTDGKPDGHFHLMMTFSEESKIKYIIMRYTEFGEHIQWAWEFNTTVPIVGSPMAVFDNGAPVSAGTDKGLACPAGKTDLDVYIPELNHENGRDTFKFQNGQSLSIQIKYITKSGQEKEFKATTQVQLQ